VDVVYFASLGMLGCYYCLFGVGVFVELMV